MTEARILPSGDHALLVESDSLDDVLSLHSRLAADRPVGVVDLVPAARTVLVMIDPRVLPLPAARAWIERASRSGAAASSREAAASVVVDVVYDGGDLAAVAEALGVSSEAVIARHTGVDWTVAFSGFAPGFGYLVSADWPYRVPRLEAPRTRVPAGSVGLAGEFTGAYPRESPGGWQLIGRTDAVLWDAASEHPALLEPGTTVRFRAVP